MKAFSERNPITIGVVGIVVLAAIGVGTFYSDDLPIIGGGTDYSARFANAAGLQTGDDVRIAGVKVGTVNSINLYHQHVLVGFKVKDAWVGDQTTAAIGIKTVLGQEYIALDPSGSHSQDSGTPIPLSRTTTPLSVADALDELSTTAGNIDTQQLAQSFETLSEAFSKTPAVIGGALNGLSRLSRTIASRDTQLQQLSNETAQLTNTLQTNDQNFTKLIQQGNLLLQELNERSAAITELLQGTTELADQLSGLVNDDQKILGPALQQLTKVTDILNANQGNLRNALRLIGPYYSLLNDAAGSGPWLDVYICGLFDSSDNPVMNSTATRNCAPKRS